MSVGDSAVPADDTRESEDEGADEGDGAAAEPEYEPVSGPAVGDPGTDLVPLAAVLDDPGVGVPRDAALVHRRGAVVVPVLPVRVRLEEHPLFDRGQVLEGDDFGPRVDGLVRTERVNADAVPRGAVVRYCADGRSPDGRRTEEEEGQTDQRDSSEEGHIR